MPISASETSSGGSVEFDPADGDDVEITPNTSIGLEASNVGDAIDELAADIHAIKNMPSLALHYQLLRDA